MSLLKKMSFRSMSPRRSGSNTDTKSRSALKADESSFRLGYKLAMETDIGGMRENQDDGFIWKHQESNSVVLAVLDGHGSDLGAFASQQARLAMIAWLEEHFERVLDSPGTALRELFAHTQQRMFEAYQVVLRKGGWEVEAQHGYLVKRRGGAGAPWACVHGGSSCSVVVLARGGRRMWTANVGDSSGVLSVNGKQVAPAMLRPLYSEEEPEPEETRFTEGMLPPAPAAVVEITWDHSPECPREFRRLRAKKPDEQDPRRPHLLVVYDSPSRKKFQCPNVFELDRRGTPVVTGQGKYYKNVRREWASLITTPPAARFHDALAFTRSLGDFHLQACGITCIPDVFEFDLEAVFASDEAPSGSIGESNVGVICLCSDGVWDNWLYEEVSSFLLDSARLAAVAGADTAEDALKEFMETNQQKAHNHFGNDADNATGILCYFSPQFA